jgi:hypothetical protein
VWPGHGQAGSIQAHQKEAAYNEGFATSLLCLLPACHVFPDLRDTVYGVILPPVRGLLCPQRT